MENDNAPETCQNKYLNWINHTKIKAIHIHNHKSKTENNKNQMIDLEKKTSRIEHRQITSPRSKPATNLNTNGKWKMTIQPPHHTRNDIQIVEQQWCTGHNAKKKRVGGHTLRMYHHTTRDTNNWLEQTKCENKMEHETPHATTQSNQTRQIAPKK